jgi:hypothetical protein
MLRDRKECDLPFLQSIFNQQVDEHILNTTLYSSTSTDQLLWKKEIYGDNVRNTLSYHNTLFNSDRREYLLRWRRVFTVGRKVHAYTLALWSSSQYRKWEGVCKKCERSESYLEGEEMSPLYRCVWEHFLTKVWAFFWIGLIIVWLNLLSIELLLVIFCQWFDFACISDEL